MASGVRLFIILLCIVIVICSFLLLGSFFKIGFLQNFFDNSLAAHPIILLSVGLALLSLLLIFTISIDRISTLRHKSNQDLLQEIETRKQVEKELQESKSFLDLGLEHLPDIIFIKDALSFKYIRINKATEEFLGMKSARVLGKTDFDIFQKEEAEFIFQRDNEVVHSVKNSILYEHFIVRNNREYWLSTRKIPLFDANGRPLFIIGISRDITEQKKQQDLVNRELEKKVSERTLELLKSEQRFRSLIENGVDVISMTDKNGVLFYVSPSIENLIGYTDIELMEKQGGTFIHPDDLEKAREVFKLALAEPGVAKRSTLRVVHKNGTVVWVEGTVINQLHHESVGAIIANYHDITDRRRVEEEKKRLEAELLSEQIERQKQIAQATLDGQERERTAIGMEMHDNINQILGVTKLYLGLAKTRPEIMPEMIEKSSENIILCIKETRKLSKSLVTTNIYKYGLHFAIQDLIEDFKESGLTFTFDVNEEQIKELDNKIQFSLYRIIQEQFNNIVKHAEATTVNISLHCVDNRVRLNVADDGKGFDTSTRHRGIGLNNIQNRVELLGGEFEIISSPNAGCTLRIEFDC